MYVFGTWKVLVSSVVFNSGNRGVYLHFKSEKRVDPRKAVLLTSPW